MKPQDFYYMPNDPRETYKRYERNIDGSLRFHGSPEPLPNYRGKGPKNYRRSDEAIYEEVCEFLTLDPDIDASGVDVEVTHGQVTLSGEVETKYLKRYAEELVAQVPGVKDVANRIRVVHGFMSTAK